MCQAAAIQSISVPPSTISQEYALANGYDQPPPDYIEKTGAKMILRPSEFIANAQDLVDLKAFVERQASRYGEIKVPVAIIAGDADKIVSPVAQARAIAAELPHATLQMLPGVGHMVHYADPALVAQVIEKIAR